jgi:hypothetical protein
MVDVGTEKLTLRHILSVHCPTCRAKPKQQCTLSTGHPCVKTHLARTLAAAKVSRPDNFVQAALRTVGQVTGRGLRALFQHK